MLSKLYNNILMNEYIDGFLIFSFYIFIESNPKSITPIIYLNSIISLNIKYTPSPIKRLVYE